MLTAERSVLLLVDLQARLMPVIADGPVVTANARRLVLAAGLLGVPVLATEQNPSGLGATVPELAGRAARVLAKTTFDATRADGLTAALPAGHTVVVLGCEAHVCVLQTVLGLLDGGRRVAVVADAVGSRAPANRAAALERARGHGAELVTTEMVVFEWLADSAHPRFREVLALIK